MMMKKKEEGEKQGKEEEKSAGNLGYFLSTIVFVLTEEV